MFKIGDFEPNADFSKIVHVTTNEEWAAQRNGTIVTKWDYCLQADDDCIKPAELDEWRQRGDDLADGVVEALDLKPGVDSLVMLREHLSSHDAPDPRVKAFWEEVNRLPPDSISALPKGRKPTPADFKPDAAIERSNRQPEPTLSEGQAFYARCALIHVAELTHSDAVQISSALVHFSLAAGLTSPKLMPTLRETNYLTSGALDVTCVAEAARCNAHSFRRLLETAQMVLDAMGDMAIGSHGWESVVRVRLLHAQVRTRIRKGKGRLNELDVARDGVPINAEDLFATLGGFSVACLWSMRRTGYFVTEREQLAYLAAWRHSVEPALLERYYTRSLSCAEKSFASLAFHIFGDVPPEDFYSTTTYRILLATSDRPPVRTSVEQHIELTRIIVGAGLAERLALPPVGLGVKLRVRAEIWAARFVNWFGRSYRHGWEVERTKLYRLIIEAVVAWQLGEKRTRFVGKEEKDYGKPLEEIGDGEESRVALGKAAGQEVTRRFRALIREMIAVCVGSVALVGLGVYMML